MMAGDAEAFEENSQDILLRTISVHDAAKPESFYHGLMLGFALYYENTYRVKSRCPNQLDLRHRLLRQTRRRRLKEIIRRKCDN